MSAASFTVEPVRWSDRAERSSCRAVREAVFVIEQHVPIEKEWDELDEFSLHVLARDAAGTPIGTGRLVPPQTGSPARIGRMAVLKAWRSRGIGAALLRTLIERARACGYAALEMHAQSHAIAFYERFGFAAYGEEFFECDIAHRNMRRTLSVAAPRARLNSTRLRESRH